MSLTEPQLATLECQATSIRRSIIEMVAEAKSGHIAGPLGMADIFAAFYFHILRHNPDDPWWDDRDRLILSNGHIVPVRYAAMAHAGYFPVEELMTLRKFGSRLQGHPERGSLPGVETTSGPLGEGLGQAAGIALGARLDGRDFHTYCIMSDGEQECGSTWEAAMFSGSRKLSNLTAIIDRNHIQIGGDTKDVMPLEPLAEKYESFNWHVLQVDGHMLDMFCDAVEEARQVTDRPTVIIANVVPGKGVSEIEGDYRWHGKAPTHEDAARWLSNL